MKPSIALNQAVLHHVLYEIQSGNLNACKAMGLSDELLRKFQKLTPLKLSKLMYSRVCWGRVAIDDIVLTRLIDSTDESREPERTSLLSRYAPGASAFCRTGWKR